MVYTGQDGFVFWMLEGTKGDADPTSDTHQPFNPIDEITTPRSEYSSEKLKWASDLSTSKIVDNVRENGEITINTFFQDPFLGLCIFTEKGTDGAWDADPETISADFSTMDHESSIGMYSREADLSGSTDLDKLFKYGRVIQRNLIVEPGKYIREEITMKFGDQEDFDGSEETFDSVADFDDGEWADWTSPIHSKNATLYRGGSEVNTTNFGFEITKITFSLEVPRTYQNLANSLVVGLDWIEEIVPTVSVEGYLTDDTFIDELETLPDSRTKSTMKLELESGTYEKYDQITNMYLASIEGLGDKPTAGEAHQVTLKFEGEDPAYSLSYKYDGTSLTDPSTRIDQ
jgi:hypothetical protein